MIATKWPIRTANREDLPEIRKFFKSLDQESRYLYFGVLASDELIDRIWERFESRDADEFFLVEVGERIIGMCQIAHCGEHAEISVVVDKLYRNNGIAHALIDRAVVWCKTHGIEDLMMYCLPDNNIIPKLIKKHSLLPLMLSQPAEAKFMIPRGNLIDHQKETWNRLVSQWLTSLKKLSPKARWL